MPLTTDASSIRPVVITVGVSTHCQMYPEGQNPRPVTFKRSCQVIVGSVSVFWGRVVLESERNTFPDYREDAVCFSSRSRDPQGSRQTYCGMGAPFTEGRGPLDSWCTASAKAPMLLKDTGAAVLLRGIVWAWTTGRNRAALWNGLLWVQDSRSISGTSG